MQPTEGTEAANAEIARERAALPAEPESARVEAQEQAQEQPVDAAEPRRRRRWPWQRA